MITRRQFLGLSSGAVVVVGMPTSVTRAASTRSVGLPRWRMPAEDGRHTRTWMCWPSSKTVWGGDLPAVQDAILGIASTIAEFEPVTLLARREEIAPIRKILKGVDVVEAPVDDLWARDTLPNFLTRTLADGTIELAASHARFNGWGGKQISSGDTRLAGIVASRLGLVLMDTGLTGEGGGVEVDGAGTVLAAASSWVNANRNPGRSRSQIEASMLKMLGGNRMVWIDGLAGHDITDGHIDTLARFVNPSTILIDKPAYDDASDVWVGVAKRTRLQVQGARTASGGNYSIVEITQPTSVRGLGNGSATDFLSTYMNYYVCNGGVIAPQFGDRSADGAAKKVLEGLFPDRDVVQLNIDALAAGGGGIHCATQQQPVSTRLRS